MADREPTDAEIERAGDVIVNRLLAYADIEERRSRFADRPALFFQGKEILHLDAPGLADLRLGRHVIRSRIDDPRSDPRVERRAGSSDWVQLRFASDGDVEDVLRWAKVAIGVDG